MTNFESFGLPTFIVEALTRMEITAPTPIQAESIPPALLGKDVIASAQTGSGKTIAYLAPLITALSQEEAKHTNALILLPTRELAIQVKTQLNALAGKIPGLEAALLIGGDPMMKQMYQLRRHPRIIIGTPGRICDHLGRRSLQLKGTSFLVLDEMDRMLDMGFEDQLREIYKHLPAERQTLMFSATLPPNIERIAQQQLNEPVRITIGSTTAVATAITQSHVPCSSGDKFECLMTELQKREGAIIVFVKTKRSADQISEYLQDRGQHAEPIHGDLQQRRRERVIRGFRQNEFRILVATDVAARGLDVPDVRHVINYDLPNCPQEYIHRIGRTGRAGVAGEAVSLVSPDDRRKWDAIERCLNPDKAGKGRRYEGGDEGYRSNNRRRSFGDRNRGGQSDGPFANYKPRDGAGEGRGRPSFGDRREGRPGFGDRREGGAARASFGDRREGRPGFGDRREGNGGRPAFGDRREGNGGRPAFGDRREGRPGFGDRREGNGGRPAFGDRREGNGGRPAFGDRREGRPGFGDRREGNGGRPSFGDRREGRSAFGDRREGGQGRSFGGDRGGRSEGRSFGGRDRDLPFAAPMESRRAAPGASPKIFYKPKRDRAEGGEFTAKQD